MISFQGPQHFYNCSFIPIFLVDFLVGTFEGYNIKSAIPGGTRKTVHSGTSIHNIFTSFPYLAYSNLKLFIIAFLTMRYNYTHLD